MENFNQVKNILTKGTSYIFASSINILPLIMMFQASRPYFHQFSNGSDVSVGLDFSNMAEAQAFAKEVFVPVIFFGLGKW